MIVWDTGPLMAAADSDDEHHARSVALMRRTPQPLLVPYPVLTEVCFMLEREKGTRAEAAFLRSISTGQISLIPLARQDLDRMVELVREVQRLPTRRRRRLRARGPRQPAERLDADAIATLDRRHFSVVRLTKPIALLP